MNTPWSILSENHKINDLSNHDSFFLENNWERIKIYPELVETAEHLILSLEKNPEFKKKITNAEYDMLIWDDVSGRPVTLLIKHIIDYFRKQSWLSWGIDNIFIDNPKLLENNPINKQWEIWKSAQIDNIKDKTKDKKILITTEYVENWKSIDWIISQLWIRENDFDIFSQTISNKYQVTYEVKSIQAKKEEKYFKWGAYDCSEYIYHIISWTWYHQELTKRNDITTKKIIGLKSTDHRHDATKENYWFAKKMREEEWYNQKTINNTRNQIKLLTEYIIKKHLS
jgi:hypothetical protein